MIFRAFETRDMRFLIDLFRIYVRPVLEYASHVWCQHLKVDITLTESAAHVYETYTMSASFNVYRKIVIL